MSDIKWAVSILGIESPDIDAATTVLAACGPELAAIIEEAFNIVWEYTGPWPLPEPEPKPSTDVAAAAMPANMAEIATALAEKGWTGLEFEVCGSWLWISGNTKPARHDLKALGCRYASKKEKWAWHEGPFRKRGRVLQMPEIRDKYGSRMLSQEEEGTP